MISREHEKDVAAKERIYNFGGDFLMKLDAGILQKQKP